MHEGESSKQNQPPCWTSEPQEDWEAESVWDEKMKRGKWGRRARSSETTPPGYRLFISKSVSEWTVTQAGPRRTLGWFGGSHWLLLCIVSEVSTRVSTVDLCVAILQPVSMLIMGCVCVSACVREYPSRPGFSHLSPGTYTPLDHHFLFCLPLRQRCTSAPVPDSFLFLIVFQIVVSDESLWICQEFVLFLPSRIIPISVSPLHLDHNYIVKDSQITFYDILVLI